MEQGKLIEKAKEFGIFATMGVVGLLIVGYGLWQVIKPEPPVVEIVRGGEVKSESDVGQVVVDVAGAVEKPGLYTLPASSRIGDALVMAGGLAATADREWVSRYVNLAEAVKDGGKVFIPPRAEENNNQTPSNNIQTNSNNQSSNLININTASVSELDSLWGIGEARAQTIIAGRPYQAVEELKTKAKIPANVYDAIVGLVSVY